MPSPGGFDPSRHIGKGAPSTVGMIGGGRSYISVHAPWSKTTKTAGFDIIITDNGELTSPISALRHHQLCNASVPVDAPFFAFETASGWAPMTRDWFLDRCGEVWTAAGLATLSGHCFRIGGATELLLRGTPPDIVAVQGGWKSRAFLEYWRKIESILPLFISNSFDQSRLTLVRQSVDVFRRKYG